MRSRAVLFPIALSVRELCERLDHIHPSVIYSAIKKRELPVYRRGVKRLILIRDVHTWIEKTWIRES